MNTQFKFKPDKIKYLSNVDTLDSSHKKITENINRKRDDVPNKVARLDELKKYLEYLDGKKQETINTFDYINTRTNVIQEINCLEEELSRIENYEDEMEYYAKTYQILFNYYDMLDGQIENEINEKYDNIQDLNFESYIATQDSKLSDVPVNNTSLNGISLNNIPISPIQVPNVNVCEENDTFCENSAEPNISSQDKDIWNFDGTQIFNSVKSSKLDTLYENSKTKRKEKKTTRKRVKNVEMLVKENNYNIFDFIQSNGKAEEQLKHNAKTDCKKKCFDYNVYDRAMLYDDYKTTLEGYSSKKKKTKMCPNCDVEKVLIYSEGFYACLNCGEVENYIVENDITNYKDPMVDKPTFPYKRKNHFCELNFNILLAKVISKLNGYFITYNML